MKHYPLSKYLILVWRYATTHIGHLWLVFKKRFKIVALYICLKGDIEQ